MEPRKFPVAVLLSFTTGCCFGGATKLEVNELISLLTSASTGASSDVCKNWLLKIYPELGEAEITANFTMLLGFITDAEDRGGENAATAFAEWLDWMIAKGSKIQRTYMVSPIAA
jgi:hypothetical protein